jgi:hypothetical protein
VSVPGECPNKMVHSFFFLIFAIYLFSQDEFGMANYTIPSIDNVIFVPFMPTAEYKVLFQFIDVELNKSIVELAISAYYRGTSFAFG